MSFHANSGGSTFPVKVIELRNTETEFKLIAKVVGKFNYDSSGCEIISITGNYDSEKWKSYVNLINRSLHIEALGILERASRTQSLVNFGYIGAGLKKNGECKYESKGLFHDENGVFSIYENI